MGEGLSKAGSRSARRKGLASERKGERKGDRRGAKTRLGTQTGNTKKQATARRAGLLLTYGFAPFEMKRETAFTATLLASLLAPPRIDETYAKSAGLGLGRP